MAAVQLLNETTFFHDIKIDDEPAGHSDTYLFWYLLHTLPSEKFPEHDIMKTVKILPRPTEGIFEEHPYHPVLMTPFMYGDDRGSNTLVDVINGQPPNRRLLIITTTTENTFPSMDMIPTNAVEGNSY